MLNNFVIHTQNSHSVLNFVYLLKATLPNPNLQKSFIHIYVQYLQTAFYMLVKYHHMMFNT